MALSEVAEGWRYGFTAMATPCEVRIETSNQALAHRLGRIGEKAALRIEHKYSRYREDSVLSEINRSEGEPVWVDAETAALLNYADRCHALSGGRFDITSGVLRRAWRFDGSDRLPSFEQVEDILPFVGWRKLVWRRPEITLQPGMEIDFGGLGKEYAVDLAVRDIAAEAAGAPFLVNFGGDLRVSGPRADGSNWRVGIETAQASGAPEGLIEIAQGALATSGDARRHLFKDGVRYSHILDPRTGWPVIDPPRSVTVAAPSCMEAGVLSTLAMLYGREAEAFLDQENLQAWWIRDPST